MQPIDAIIDAMPRSTYKRIAVCLAGLQAYQLGILTGIRRALRSRPEWRIRVESTWAIKPEHVRDANVDAIVGELYATDVLDEIVRTKLPTVALFGSMREGAKQLSVLGTNDKRVGEIAAEHLIERGYTSFAVIGTDHYFSRKRAESFATSLQTRGHTLAPETRLLAREAVRSHPLDVPGSLNVSCMNWLENLPARTAIFATSDRVARAVAQACHTTGRKVPGELGLLGVDNDPAFCESSVPEISSVNFPWEQMGARACELLEDLFAGRKNRLESVLPTGVESRASTDDHGPDEAVARAIAFIRDNLHRPINPQDVIEHVGLAKRTLQRRFAAAVGHGLREELQSQRVLVARKLLESTDLTLAQIARKIGLSGAAWLGSVFGRMVGVTPGEYRERSGR
jgi:LacI family transcriptional regulator